MPSRRLLALAFVLTALALAPGCTPGGMSPGDDVASHPMDASGDAVASDAAPSNATLPCAVDAVLRAHCQACHSSPPAFGAPMPLVTYADTQATLPSATSPVWQLMHQRVDSTGADRMPPTDLPALSATEKAAMDAWFASSAPIAPPGDACTSDGGVATDAGGIGPAYLPCPTSQQTTFRVHGDGPGSTFHVDPTASNEFVCFTFASHFAAGAQATAFAPAIGDSRVVHHYILYATQTAQTDGAFGPCHLPTDAVFVTGWAPGAGNTVFPDNVGLALPAEGQSFILQMHYYNIDGYTDANDDTAVAVCTAPTPRAETAVVMTLGSTAIAIPPHATNYAVTSDCSAPITAPLHVIRAAPHMHLLGTSIESDRLVGGATGAVDPIVAVDTWSFNNQANILVDAMINPGDVVRTTCHYDNTTNAPVLFGEDTQNEMCFDFLTVWPASALPTRAGAPQTHCVSTR